MVPCFRTRGKERIAAAVVLGVGRAIGEAMAVMMVSGNVPICRSFKCPLPTAVASEMSIGLVAAASAVLQSVGAVSVHPADKRRIQRAA